MGVSSIRVLLCCVLTHPLPSHHRSKIYGADTGGAPGAGGAAPEGGDDFDAEEL